MIGRGDSRKRVRRILLALRAEGDDAGDTPPIAFGGSGCHFSQLREVGVKNGEVVGVRRFLVCVGALGMADEAVVPASGSDLQCVQTAQQPDWHRQGQQPGPQYGSEVRNEGLEPGSS